MGPDIVFATPHKQLSEGCNVRCCIPISVRGLVQQPTPTLAGVNSNDWLRGFRCVMQSNRGSRIYFLQHGERKHEM